MEYSDTLTKAFLTGNGEYVPTIKSTTSRWNSNQDPTYMGFWVNIPPIVDFGPDDYDYLPQGLLMPDGPRNTANFSDSAVSYLKRRNEFYRAAMIEEFQQGFLYILHNTPWLVTKITGLADLVKIDPTKPFRTKEVTIVLECSIS